MIRFVVQLTGLVALAAAFATFVVDGTRSIAAGTLLFTSVSVLLGAHLSDAQQAFAHRGLALLWDPGVTTLLRLPLTVMLAASGFALMALARKPAPRIGHSMRP